MIVAFDLDGTLDAYPAQLGGLMRMLKKAGVQIIIISGSQEHALDLQTQEHKLALIQQLGLTDAYDELVVVNGPESTVAHKKALYLRSVGADVLIDNSMRNARAMRDANVVALVPWNARSEY